MRFAITSVHYSDFLAVTLPGWKAVIPEGLVVATSPDDRDTQVVAAAHGVPVVQTTAWYERAPDGHEGGDPTMNIGYGLNVALGLAGDVVAPAADGELVGHASADCYPFGSWPDDATLAADCLYGFWRHACPTQRDLDAHLDGRTTRAHYPKLKNSGGRPVGYFQVFRAGRGRKFPSYPTAGKFDTAVIARFPRWEMRDEVYLLHLGPHDNHQNWAGRCVPRWVA